MVRKRNKPSKEPKPVKHKRGNINALKFIKEALALIGGLAGSILAVYGLVKTFKDDAEGFSWLIPVGVIIWFIILWRLFQVRRMAAYGLLIISILAGVSGWIGWHSQVKATDDRVVVLVAKFDGPEEKYGVRDQILEQLRTATRDYQDVDIIAADEVVTSAQGSEYARELGKEVSADLVIWSWYRPTENPNITLHIENLSSEKLSNQDKSETYQPQATLAELESFTVQKKLGTETSAIVRFLAGVIKFKNGEYEEASKRFEQILLEKDTSMYIDKSLLYSYLGDCYLSLMKFENAITNYSKVIEFDPTQESAYNNRGFAHYIMKQYELALEDYDKAIEIDPSYFAPYANRAGIYLDRQQYQSAIQSLEQAIKLKPDHSPSYYNLGYVYYSVKEDSRAIENFDKAIEVDPSNESAYAMRGLAYADLKQYDQALQDYTKSIELNPFGSETYNNRALVYSDLRQYDLAIQDFNKAIAMAPAVAGIYNNRGNAYYQLGQYNLAISDYTECIMLDSSFAPAYISRGYIFQKLGKTAEAEADFKKYEELTGEKP